MRILIIGGDRRMLFLSDKLKNSGYSVSTIGLIKGETGDIKSADVIILPPPATRDKVNINCKETNEIIPLDILNSAKRGAKIFGGGKLRFNNYTDYLDLDEYAVKNAALTAEGAISYAIENTDFSLWKSSILVIGYGRVGKVIVNRLSAFSPNLTVSARSGRDFAALDSIGINHIKTCEAESRLGHFDIVFNTVDINLSYKAEKGLSPTLFIDLSSSGGIKDESGGIIYKRLPGIPGKTAPRTAGEIIAETIISLLS